VTAETFHCSVSTVIPNKSVTLGTDPSQPGFGNLAYAPDAEQPHDKDGHLIVPNTDFGAGPAGLSPQQFRPAVTMRLAARTSSVLHVLRRFSNAPKALWEKKNFSNGVPSVDPATGLTEATIPDALTGFELVPYLRHEDMTVPVPLESLLATRGRAKQFRWSLGVPPAANPFTDQKVVDTIDDPTAAGVRLTLLEALAGQDVVVDPHVNVTRLADPATIDLEAPPRLRLLGGPPRVVAAAEGNA
jgi:hypothetical protein